MPFDAGVISPSQDGFAGEFAAIVAATFFGFAALDHQPVQFRTTRTPVSEVSATSARHSHVQSSKTVRMRMRRPVGELIRQVERPAVVRRHRNQHRRPGPIAHLRPPRGAPQASPPDRAERAKRRRFWAMAFTRWRRSVSSVVWYRMASARYSRPPGVADAVFAAQIGDRNAASRTIKIPVIYSSEEQLRFMLWSSSWARANFNLD